MTPELKQQFKPMERFIIDHGIDPPPLGLSLEDELEYYKLQIKSYKQKLWKQEQ